MDVKGMLLTLLVKLGFFTAKPQVKKVEDVAVKPKTAKTKSAPKKAPLSRKKP